MQHWNKGTAERYMDQGRADLVKFPPQNIHICWLVIHVSNRSTKTGHWSTSVPHSQMTYCLIPGYPYVSWVPKILALLFYTWWWVSYSVWSFDDTMNEHSELCSILCQVHHSWQLCLSPIGDIIQPLPSLPALSACPRHWSEHYVFLHGWVTYYTWPKYFSFLDLTRFSNLRLWLIRDRTSSLETCSTYEILSARR